MRLMHDNRVCLSQQIAPVIIEKNAVRRDALVAQDTKMVQALDDATTVLLNHKRLVTVIFEHVDMTATVQ